MAVQRIDTPCSNCQCSKKCTFFSALPRDRHEEARRRRTSYDLARGAVLFHDGEHPTGIWVICTGRVKIIKQTPEGKPLITRTAQPGEMVGYRAFFNGMPFRAIGEAMEKTRVSYFEGPFIHSLVLTCGDFSHKMLNRLAKDLANAEEIATNMAYRNAHDRVLDALYDYHRRKVDEGLAEWQFAIPRRELAELAGLTVETIVRVLKALEREGYLTIDGRQINVIDTKRLVDSVKTEPYNDN